MTVRKYIAIGILAASISAASCDLYASSPADTAPNVSIEEVKAIFGDGLNTDNPVLQRLLLAIGMERTRHDMTFQEQKIGVPYIVDATPEYWATKFAEGDKRIDTLVNSALLLLFADSPIPNADLAAVQLLNEAASKGYWPASSYMAEFYVARLIEQAADPQGSIPMSVDYLANLGKATAEQAMGHLNVCASAGFAPCQYRIGFWLSDSAADLNNGLTVLREAIRTTLADARYEGYVDSSFHEAVTRIYEKGAEIGLSETARNQYLDLLTKYSSVERIYPSL
ncbi:hypothetical protein [Zhongshania marina]|uniref:Uncharacterized protein n=1 Tax=Zhongshania marina TaxID=2304603 RepID=A0A2S4HFZ9_9GAMM|nr:hypothetical protein [Marortus luteolus]POP52621.1 hypothetical protein C0068_11120 [Marortus luteolus]